MTIKCFKCKETQKIFYREHSKKFPEAIQFAARKKLLMLHYSENLNDLRVPPGNRLEKLCGNRQGAYSIHINQQWRICFEWSEGEARHVEIVDYHH